MRTTLHFVHARGAWMMLIVLGVTCSARAADPVNPQQAELKMLRSAEDTARLRGKTVEELRAH